LKPDTVLNVGQWSLDEAIRPVPASINISLS